MDQATQEFIRTAAGYLDGSEPAYATTLLGILLKAYGAEALNWDPLTIESQLKDDFGVELGDDPYEQLMALINVMATDSVYQSVTTFDATVSHLMALNSHDVDAPNPYELAWAVFEILINDPDPHGAGDSVCPFCKDIQNYCGVILADAGFKKPPTTLSFAQMPKWATPSLGNDPVMAEGANASEMATSEDVDRHVEHHAGQLIAQLKSLGIDPSSIAQASKDDLPQEDPLKSVLG
jgi:hypothetical protein